MSLELARTMPVEDSDSSRQNLNCGKTLHWRSSHFSQAGLGEPYPNGYATRQRDSHFALLDITDRLQPLLNAQIDNAQGSQTTPDSARSENRQGRACNPRCRTD